MNLLPDIKVKVDGRRNKVIMRRRTIDNFFSAMQWAKDKNDDGCSWNQSSVSGKRQFTATKNIDEYVGMLRDGWEHGVEDMQALDGITSDAAERLAFHRQPGGAFPIVPAYLANDPNSMLMPVQDVSENTRGLTLVVDSCFSGGVSSQTILDYAKTIMKLVAWLSAERIECSVYSVIPIRMGSKRVVYSIPIREAGDVFQPERVAAVLHPSWLRRAWFAMVEYEFHHDDGKTFPECAVCRGGYGGVTNTNAIELREALPESYSVIMLPKPGDGDPTKAVEEVTNLKIRL